MTEAGGAATDRFHSDLFNMVRGTGDQPDGAKSPPHVVRPFNAENDPLGTRVWQSQKMTARMEARRTVILKQTNHCDWTGAKNAQLGIHDKSCCKER